MRTNIIASENNKSSIKNKKTKYADFAARFRHACKKAKAPRGQVALGEYLGYSQPTVWAWLHGKKIPSLPSAIKISAKLGCSVDWLLSGTDSGSKVAPRMERRKRFKNLSQNERALIELLLESFNKNKLK